MGPGGPYVDLSLDGSPSLPVPPLPALSLSLFPLPPSPPPSPSRSRSRSLSLSLSDLRSADQYTPATATFPQSD